MRERRKANLQMPICPVADLLHALEQASQVRVPTTLDHPALHVHHRVVDRRGARRQVRVAAHQPPGGHVGADRVPRHELAQGGGLRLDLHVNLDEVRALAAWMTGTVELVGGLLLIIGLVTTVTAGILSAIMIGAFWFVTRARGIFVDSGGSEYVVVLFAALLMRVVFGPGRASVDGAVGQRD